MIVIKRTIGLRKVVIRQSLPFMGCLIDEIIVKRRIPKRSRDILLMDVVVYFVYIIM